MVHFRDPIHGDLIFNGVLEELIQCDEFQRLTEVKQLGTSDKIYPGATHTRFSHALGVCFVAGELAAAFKVPEKDRLLLQIAALLHDIGHYDFSHALEHLAPFDHEENGKRIILGEAAIPYRNTGQIPAVLKKHSISPATIIQLLHKEGDFPAFYYTILSSPLVDCDRLDFLKRDSYFSGALISVDISRILAVLVVHPKTQQLGVLYKGVPTIEQFLVARNHMYRAVYFHRLTDIGETMLLKAVAASREVALPLMYGDDFLLARLLEHGTPLTKALIQRLRVGQSEYYDTAFSINAASPTLRLPQDRDAVEKALLEATHLEDGDILVSMPGSHRKPNKVLPEFPVLMPDGTWVDLFDISPIATSAMQQHPSSILLVVYTKPEHVAIVQRAAEKLLS